MFYNERMNRGGGGTAIFILNILKFHLIDNLIDDIEHTQVEVLCGNSTPIRIVSLYLPPNLPLKESSLEQLFSGPNTFLLGDFNAKNPLWGSPHLDTKGKVIERLINNSNFICLNTGSGTRLNSSNGLLSHLDLTLCSANLGQLSSWCTLKDTWGSDHYPTQTTYSNNLIIDSQPEPRWNIARADWKEFSLALALFRRSLTLLQIH